ncbi:MerR family transcriptional regulator [Clostridium vitabionis]|uniref:MerR family transcriptional regulator n=1 Tax=Clostridium vitabionis TaxID=2784388 RepID=UPI001A9B0F8A|nr:MerR family transcriptional regulator [Clostridium vitabionis]
MAELNHTTVATLRLYDKEGLLTPTYTDPATGYRYYDIQKNARLDMIQYMKELGMSLGEIRSVLKSGDLARIESILAERNEQIYAEIRDLKTQQNAVERAIHALERYRKSPVRGTISLEFNERRYIWAMPCTKNFYDGDLADFEDCLTELRNALIQNHIPKIHTYSIGTSILRKDFEERRFAVDQVFILGDYTLYKTRNDLRIVDAGMYACIYADNYDEEVSYANRLFAYCREHHYRFSGDYICEVLSEFNVFDENRRNMFLRLQVPIQFEEQK